MCVVGFEQEWGANITQWTSQNIMDAGSIMAGFSADELSEMNIDINVLEVLGGLDHEVFQQDQVHVYSRHVNHV